MDPIVNKYRQDIAKRVRDLRRKRGWTQAELAKELDLSQNRLSELEAGKGSFSAEQLLVLAKFFNVTPSSFVAERKKGDSDLQNALARLGASHLGESDAVLPSEKLNDVVKIVQEVLATAKSPRHITALAPVLVNNAEPSFLNQIRLQINQSGLLRRYRWLLENIRWAISRELEEELSREDERKYKKAAFVIDNLLKFPWFGTVESIEEDDILDPDITSEKTVTLLRPSLSDISKKLKVITRIQQDDFVQALKEARETR